MNKNNERVRSQKTFPYGAFDFSGKAPHLSEFEGVRGWFNAKLFSTMPQKGSPSPSDHLVQ